MVVRAASAEAVADAAARLCAGEVVAMPTETVYGLAADARNPQAVARIFALKGRPRNHPLIVHIAEAAAMLHWALDLPEAARILAEAFWPGPLTLILPRRPEVPDAVTGGQDTVGLRCPDHPVAQALLRQFVALGGSGGLAAPSANRFGRISPTRAEHVVAEFGEAVPLVLDGGASQVGIESTIVDLSRGVPVLLRPGSITAEQLQSALGEPVYVKDQGQVRLAVADAPRYSGGLAAHYAPKTRLRMVAATALPDATAQARALGERIAVWAFDLPAAGQAPGVAWRLAPPDASSYARALYATLRELDEGGYDWILIEQPPASPDWVAVRDRLGRAAAGSGHE